MPLYAYKGYELATGKSVRGQIESDSQKSARHQLKQRDKIIISEIKETSGKRQKRFGLDFSIGQTKVRTADIAVTTRQFATLAGAHVPLDESLKALTAQVEHPVLKSVLSQVKDRISEGKSLADGMAEFPKVFSKLYVNMVRAGESSGKLDVVLDRLADFLEDQDRTRGKIMSAMTYPVVMILASSGVVAFLFVSIVPQLMKVFESLRVTLPWYTKLCIGISNILQTYWFLIVLCCAALFFLYKRYRNTEHGRYRTDELFLKVPMFGGIMLRVLLSRLTKTLSTLLNSGVPIIQSLDITKNVITNVLIADLVEKAKIAVQEGQSLGRVFGSSEYFPPLVSQMINTGEQTGELETMLSHVADAYDAEVERKINALISVIEPLMIIVMGGITVFVVFSLIMPMMSVMRQIRG